MPERVGEGLRALVVDDEEVVRSVVLEVLEGMGFLANPAESLTAGRERLAGERYDLLIIDKNLPDGSGLSLAREVAEGSLDAQVVIISGYATLSSAVEALQAGVADFVVKPFDLADFRARLQRTIESPKLRRAYRMLFKELREKNAILEGLATRDPLTGLDNHASFQESVSREIERGRRYGARCAVVLASIDRFRDINANLGFSGGDALLRDLGAFLLRSGKASGAEPAHLLVTRAIGGRAAGFGAGAARSRQAGGAAALDPRALVPVRLSTDRGPGRGYRGGLGGADAPDGSGLHLGPRSPGNGGAERPGTDPRTRPAGDPDRSHPQAAAGQAAVPQRASLRVPRAGRDRVRASPATLDEARRPRAHRGRGGEQLLPRTGARGGAACGRVSHRGRRSRLRVLQSQPPGAARAGLRQAGHGDDPGDRGRQPRGAPHQAPPRVLPWGRHARRVRRDRDRGGAPGRCRSWRLPRARVLAGTSRSAVPEGDRGASFQSTAAERREADRLSRHQRGSAIRSWGA